MLTLIRAAITYMLLGERTNVRTNSSLNIPWAMTNVPASPCAHVHRKWHVHEEMIKGGKSKRRADPHGARAKESVVISSVVAIRERRKLSDITMYGDIIIVQ